MKCLLISAAALLVLSGTGMAQTNPLFVTDGDGARLAIVQGGQIQSLRTTHVRGYPIVVGSSLWIGDYLNNQPDAIEYTLAGDPTGLTVPYTSVGAVDAATDDAQTFQLGNAFSNLATVYAGGLQFQSSTPLFNVAGNDLVGIAFDRAAGTLWISDRDNLYQYSTAGTLVSSFAHVSGRGTIAYERATDTIWYVRNASDFIDQYSKAGALLQSLAIAGLTANNWGAEFGVAAAGGGGGAGNLPSSVTVTSSQNPSVLGQAVTFRVDVSTGTPAFVPSGTVQVRDGGSVLGNVTLDGLGRANLTTSTLTVGPHTISAYYFGDVNYAPAISALLTQTVGLLPTSTTALASSVNPSRVGQAVTLTATVSPGAATGTVTFKDGSTTLGAGSLAGGVATLTTSALTAGVHSLSAVYGGNASYQGSTSAPLSQTVKADDTTTFLTSSANPARAGELVTFTAMVSPSAATGTVTFRDGANTLGTGTVSGGVATHATSSLTVGVHTLTATYAGDPTYESSTSAALSQSITNLGGCTSAGPDILCVQQGGRFTVKVAWTNQYAGNTTGVGTAFVITSDSGFFTFFSANNIELVVKVLDGTQVNGRFWVLYGALSDVGYTITVTDAQTSVVKTYVNAPGTLASVADTTAFAARPGQAVSDDEAAATYGQLATLQLREALVAERPGGPSGRVAAPLLAVPAEGACATSGGTLCLNGGRFSVTTTWQNYNDGSTGTGTAASLTGDSGYFWFFNAANVELMLKVLDGRAVNGKFWFLSGALSDVGYAIAVTDTTTGAQKVYTNPARSLNSFIDINAF